MKQMILMVFLSLLLACSGDKDGGGQTDPVSPDAGVAMSDASVAVDAEMSRASLTVTPSQIVVPASSGPQVTQVSFELAAGMGDVQISSVALELPQTTSRLLYRGTFQTGIDYDGTDRFAYPLTVSPSVNLPMMLEVAARETEAITGQIVIIGDFEGERLEIPIIQGGVGPQLTLSAMSFDFGRVAENTSKSENLVLTNTGESPLELQNVLLRSFGVDFSVNLNGESAIENQALYQDPDGDGEPGIAPGQSVDLSITYAPMSEGSDDATLTIRTNDAQNPEQQVSLVANSSYSCLAVTPETMQCSGALRQLTVCDTRIVVSNCDDTEALIVDEVRMNASTDAFFIDEDSLPEFPHSVAVGGSFEIPISYLPGVARENHMGNLFIHANDLETPNRNIQIIGSTPCETTDDCPPGGEYTCDEATNKCVFMELPSD